MTAARNWRPAEKMALCRKFPAEKWPSEKFWLGAKELFRGIRAS